jgi:hypothetical protein
MKKNNQLMLSFSIIGMVLILSLGGGVKKNYPQIPLNLTMLIY